MAGCLLYILPKNTNMIQQLTDVPANMVAFKASGEVTKEDFENIVLPAVKKLVDATGELNYMLVLETSVKNFTAGAWMKDALLGIQNLTKWNRAAIITDSEGIKTFTDIFSKLMIGEFKGYSHSEQAAAVQWVSGGKTA